MKLLEQFISEKETELRGIRVEKNRGDFQNRHAACKVEHGLECEIERLKAALQEIYTTIAITNSNHESRLIEAATRNETSVVTHDYERNARMPLHGRQVQKIEYDEEGNVQSCLLNLEGVYIPLVAEEAKRLIVEKTGVTLFGDLEISNYYLDARGLDVEDAFKTLHKVRNSYDTQYEADWLANLRFKQAGQMKWD